ncbi:peptidoglycan-binding protein [Streptomyces adustus]|uniref:peptidoglycan-binding domain-containing protein n=1 Tax=Streptomyces adustus TaxID=1609272 RepID=UPI0035E3B01B
MEQVATKISHAFEVQDALFALGFKPGRQDGADGPATQTAARAFQSVNGIAPANGVFDDVATMSTFRYQLTNAGFDVPLV